MEYAWNVRLNAERLLELEVKLGESIWSGTGTTVASAAVGLAIEMGASSIISWCKAERLYGGGFAVKFCHQSMKMFTFETPADCKDEISAMVLAAIAYAQSKGHELNLASEVAV